MKNPVTIKSNNTMTDITAQETEKKLKLYSDLGRFFDSDGSFREGIFRELFAGNIGRLRGMHASEADADLRTAESISEYIAVILDYLEVKKLPDAAVTLFKAARDEAAAAGIADISIQGRHTSFLLSASRNEPKKSEKNRPVDEKIKMIYDAALNVFEDEGFRKATMDKIAQSAGIGKASVYRIFKNKEELLDKLLQQEFDIIVRGINKINSSNTEVTEQISEMIRYWIGYVSHNHTVYQLIQTESNSEGIHNKVLFYHHLTSNLPMFKERIVSQNLQNRLKTINFYTVFYGILGYIDGVIIKWMRSGHDYNLSDEIPEIIDVLFSGFVEYSEIPNLRLKNRNA